MFTVLNSEIKENFEYDKKWFMKLVNGNKLKTMLYIKGKMGIGKGSVANFFSKVLGINTSLYITNVNQIMGEFNGSLMGKALVVLDEICQDFNDFKSLYNSLKPYITEPYISYRNLYEKLKTKNIKKFIKFYYDRQWIC